MVKPDPTSTPKPRFTLPRRSVTSALLGTTAFWLTQPSTSVSRALAHEAAAAPYKPQFFTAEEYSFLTAATERLFPKDHNGPGATELGVPEFIDRQMQTPYGVGDNWYMSAPFQEGPANLGYQLPLVPRALYRRGITALEQYARQQYGTNFASLSAQTQDAILTALEGGSIQLHDIPGRTFFEQLRTNTLEGAFSDPLYGGNHNLGGWLMLGFPGARADFMDWVNQEGAAYPLPPVSISGQTA
ncbi:gluconate 2-dehydrogenase subunit 3 family protein [Neokomagataea anthophila]|uniref:Gluconate 2-dehydrogenase subunit 3 family protein n=1 Tax=Neokomagataea anthophila TaxID=2826925 RepID=A0ABS5E920_9PROT|nr:gluconate 2-dehydrogenase subunit 3 family protein [Neokomagataea anthophila]MBR0560296.1 gluconate 2-dehydrogenase subunit 3 family protein [Neokomagataea anthophila]